MSADVLHKQQYFASSVHCSYYSLFQKMKYVVKNTAGISYDEYETKSKLSPKSSHVFLIEWFCSEFQKKGNSRREKEALENTIVDLKTLRIKADYTNIRITPKESGDAYDTSDRLQQQIKLIFKI